MRKTLLTIFAIGFSVAPGLVQAKDSGAEKRLDAAADLMTDMMKADDKGIPQDLLNRAQCVVAVPGLKKGGIIGLGAKYGRGFAMCRKSGGMGWSAPAAVKIEGGSVGPQIGISEQDVLLLVMNESGMKRLLSSKFTIGGEATAAAGPVGREASAQTDISARAEILSYSRARGLFAGLAIQGATMRPDDEANTELYGANANNKDILTGATAAPASAAKLNALLNKNSSQQSK